MAAFIYFVEGVTKPQDAGLGYAFDESPPKTECKSGPDGKSGWLHSTDPDCLRYLPDSQEWTRISDSVYVGRDKNATIVPYGLIRKDVVPGEDILLADDNAWHVPRLRVFMGEHGFQTVFPRRLKRKDGEWVLGEVLALHEEADKLGSELLEKMMTLHNDGNDPDVQQVIVREDEAADYATRLLAMNYRVGPEELGMLGCLATSTLLGQILSTATDYKNGQDWALKKVQARDDS